MVTDLNVPRKRQNSSKLKLRVWKEVFNMLGSCIGTCAGQSSGSFFRTMWMNGGLARNWLAATPVPTDRCR